ncbi:MAG TPA: SAM-dependent methyltransferase, partial [Sphingomonadales bacterium]|nr:SAM-dependent methyltransferase [Sphingomonadales bacterium]
MAEFKDHFSAQSWAYCKFRPSYPQELYSYLSGLCTNHGLAWDCATGNGQAARGLAKYFERVIANDASEE